MFIQKNNIFALCSLLFALLLAACAGGGGGREWGEYNDGAPTTAPEHLGGNFEVWDMADSEPSYCPTGPVWDMPDFVDPRCPVGPSDHVWDSDITSPASTVAVLLPLSGPNAKLGLQIKHAIEIAFFQKQPRDILLSFHDLSGNHDRKVDIIEGVVERYPDIIIGPIFAEDAKLVRDMKADKIPVLAFTSDPNALGYGVLSMALMPNQSVETIVRRISSEGFRNVLFLAPDNNSGYMNATAAIETARTFGLHIAGLYYYGAGNTDSIKETAECAALYGARTAAMTRAREVLSNILIKEQLCPADKASLTKQLDTLNKKDSLGDVPYDAVLFLGTAADSKMMASFLRYYDLNQKQVKFFGTALWDSTILFNDVTIAGSEYSSLPAVDAAFSEIFKDVQGAAPERIASMGYDAATLAIHALTSPQATPRALLNPSGYVGLDGMFRLLPDGTNERALEIMELTGTGSPRLIVPAARNFSPPLYDTGTPPLTRPAELEAIIQINPNDFIKIPAEFSDKYRSQTYGGRGQRQATPTRPLPQPAMILPEDDSDDIDMPDFQPMQDGPIVRTYIDSVEVFE